MSLLDVTYFSSVCWLSSADTSKRFWHLRGDIKFFMESRKQDVSFLNDVE